MKRFEHPDIHTPYEYDLLCRAIQKQCAIHYLSLCSKRDEEFHRKLFPYLLALAIILTLTLAYTILK